jgi:hypothetical protein
MATATANACAPATSIDSPNASGVDSVAISSPTIFNYPRQPPRDDGRLLALASLVGGFLDATMGGDGIAAAQAAEGTWKGILDNIMYPRGQQELGRVDSERAKLAPFESDLQAMMLDYRAKADKLWPLLGPMDKELHAQIVEVETRSDDEWAYLTPLDTWLHESMKAQMGLSVEERSLANGLCTADALNKLCEYVACGYVPDYRGISERARGDAEAAVKVIADDACRTSKRYHVRSSHHAAREISTAILTAALGNTARLREAERMKAFELNTDMRFKHAQFLEGTRQARMNYSTKLRNDSEQIADRRWGAHFGASNTLDTRGMEALRERWTRIATQYREVEQRGDVLSEAQYRMFAESASRSMRDGGEMLAAAAQAYQFLAASIRQTAKQGGAGAGGITSALGALAVLIPMFGGSCEGIPTPFGTFNSRPQDCCKPA